MIRVQRDDFDVGAEIEALSRLHGSVGAIATFTGYVRGEDGLEALILEHYPAMTEREIARHVESAREKWLLHGVAIVHRVGRLAPGERIVFVGVAAAHRRTAFQACEFLMDYLKAHAPFWKQEERATGTIWIEAKTSDADAAKRWR